MNVLCVKGITYENSKVYLKNMRSFTGDEEKHHAEFL